MGSRVRTRWRKDRCPSVAYGLPWGLLARSAVALHAGHRPGLGWRLGQPGVEQTRMDAMSGVYLLGAGAGVVEGCGTEAGGVSRGPGSICCVVSRSPLDTCVPATVLWSGGGLRV